MDETEVGRVQVRRKGRNQKSCEIVVGYDETEALVVLRTQDVSGVAPIVAVLSNKQALEVAQMLQKAAANAQPWS